MDMTEDWVLLAEDDKLFAMLFARYWKQSYSQVNLVQVATIAEARRELESRVRPLLAVLDYNLPDGSSTELESELSCPSVTWSSCADGPLAKKPEGREELTGAIQTLAEKAGLVPH